MKDMTKGNPTKLILSFLAPLLIGNIFQQLYSMVDTIIVGRFVGTEALAGVGSTGGINFLMLGFIMGLTSGFSIPIAKSFGAEDNNKVRHYTMVSIYICILLSILMTLFGAFFTSPILKLLKTPPDIFEHAFSYIFTINLGITTAIFYNLLGSISRALGDSKTPLYFLILASILNIILDLVFILNFSMGVMGAGLATVISQGVSAILCGIYMLKKFKILKFKKKDLVFSNKSAKHLLKIGMPMALQFSITAIGTMIVQFAVNSLGSIIVASFTAGNRVEQLVFQPVMAMGTAIATYTSQNLGAGKLYRIEKGIKSGFKLCIIMAILSYLLINFFGDTFIKLFINEPDLQKLNTIMSYSINYLKISSIFFIFVFLLVLYRNALQGMGNTFTPMVAGIMELLGRCLVSVFLVNKIGFMAITVASPFAWVLATLILMPSYYIYIKKKKLQQNN